MAPWSLLALVGLLVCLRGGIPPRPDLGVLLSCSLCLLAELAAVRLPIFGYFSTGFAVALSLSSSQPEHQAYAAAALLLAVSLRNAGRGGGMRSAVADLAPGLSALAAASFFEAWQGRCLSGILVYYAVAELCQPRLAAEHNRSGMMTFTTTREWTALYRWSILFLAPVLVCLHLYYPLYILLGLPLLAGVQRAAYSELSRLRLLDQEILMRKEAESRLKLSETQDQLEETTRHLRLREFSETMLLELTRALSVSQDVRNTAQSALQTLGRRIHFHQLAIFVVEREQLKPLFWMGDSAQPQLPMMLEQQLQSGQPVLGVLSVWPLEREGALTVSTHGKAPLTPEEIHLVNVVASQTALGLQSARRYLEQQKTQAGVMTASKMAAVGQLAAGIAHELNTPLGAVQLQVELVQMQPNLPPAAEKALDVASKALEHSHKIISRLLYYSREGAADRQNFDLNQIVRDTLQMIGRQLQIDGVQVETQLSNSDCTAHINANEIQQVVTNLVLNAKDSCLEKSAVGKKILVRTVRAGREVAIEVLDQGAGIPEHIRERIFEPFFTSKPVGKGVGLGLSVSLELVAQHGGTLIPEPGPQPWTTLFRLRLPAVR